MLLASHIDLNRDLHWSTGLFEIGTDREGSDAANLLAYW